MEQIKMTDELRKQMAGLLPMNRTSTYKYTPEAFDSIDESFRPVFEIKQFTNMSMLKVKELVVKEIDTNKKKINIKDIDDRNTEYMKLLHEGLVGWDNLYDLGTGELFDYDGKFETMMALPEGIRTDIFSEALKISGFSGGM